MLSCGLSDKGLVRSLNQDYYDIVQDDNGFLAIVCDGIGGNKAGEVASNLATKFLVEQFNEDKNRMQHWLVDAIELVNRKVYDESLLNVQYTGMGTTMVCLYYDGHDYYVANIGDSRCYVIKDNDMRQITVDHSLINELMIKQSLDYDVASKLVGKNIINRAIGVSPEVDVDLFKIEDDFDKIILCSDGLHGYVSENTICQIANENDEINKKCQKLIQVANDAGGLDNVTVILLQR